jgi:hypothetical protein
MRFNQIDAKIVALPNIGAAIMATSELDRLKALNTTLLEALRLAEVELRLVVEECHINDETHEGCEKAGAIAVAAIFEAGGEPVDFGIQ